MDKHWTCERHGRCANIPVNMRAGDMRVGEKLGEKYVLEQLLGKGGMGAVWAALDTETQQKVAIKVIIPQIEEELTNELRIRLRREAGACDKLQHPNIIRVYEVGETDHGNTYMVLELLDGQPLGDVLKQKRRLEPKVAARIAADIASGLAEAHAAKVIHRDLKPANIFLHREPGMAEDDFVTKVLDFGVCIDREAMDTVKTRAGIIVGSPAYMSPEQVAMRKDIDGRTDIWSLGLILYEMVTGMRVFNGNVQNVMAQIITQPVPAPSSKVRDVPPDLDAVVARCTQVKKEMRYAEAGELARDLYVIAGVRPVVRQPSTSRSSIAKVKPLVGLMEAYEQDILSSPAVPQPGSARTFNPVGATIPLIPPERRAEVEKMPPVMPEDEELAATLPLQSKHLAMVRPPKPFEEFDAAKEASTAAGTQFLRVDAPIASPAPQWKQEMERALQVHRQSSTTLPAFDAEAQAKLAEISQSVDVSSLGAAEGTQMLAAGTQMLAAGTQMLATGAQWGRPDIPLRTEPSVTTSTVSTMSTSTISSPEIGATVRTSDSSAVTGRRKRRSSRGLYAAAAFLGSAAILLITVVILQKRAKAKVETASVPEVAASQVLPFPPVTSDVVPGAAVEVAAPVESAVAPPSMPSAAVTGSAGPGTAAAVPSALVAPAQTTPPVAVMPTNSAPANPVLSAAPVKKAPTAGTSTAKKAPAPKEVCSGTGVFRHCKKVP